MAPALRKDIIKASDRPSGRLGEDFKTTPKACETLKKVSTAPLPEPGVPMYCRSASKHLSPLLIICIAFGLSTAGCRFTFDNPAEHLGSGQLRGQTVQEKGGAPGEFEALPEVKVQLRGAPFALHSRPTGYFSFVDLPPGPVDLLFEYQPKDKPRQRFGLRRQQEIALGPDQQPEGVNLGKVSLLHTAALRGVVVDEEGNPVSSAVVSESNTLLSVISDEKGRFTFDALPLGTHQLRAAALSKPEGEEDDPEAEADLWQVGGVLEVEITPDHQRKTVEAPSALALHPASGKGKLRLKVGLVNSTSSPFGLDEIRVMAQACGSQEEILLAAPNKKGVLEDKSLKEGCWHIEVRPPPGSKGFDFPTRVANTVLLEQETTDLGSLLLFSTHSIARSRNSCEQSKDCGKDGVCKEGQCTGSSEEPQDPCDLNNGGCHESAICSSKASVVSCSCPEGQFLSEELGCVTPIPCSGTLLCGDNAGCVEQEGEEQCACLPGFHDQGAGCINIDECSELDPLSEAPLHNCHPQAVCSDTEGSFECSCKAGFVGDGQSCEDIDECEDLDEATQLPLHSCPPSSTCVNTEGSYTCKCPSGFKLEGESCVDINECEEIDPLSQEPLHNCSENSLCINTDGAFSCECDEGYRFENGSCVNINECEEFEPDGETPLHTCTGNTQCLDTEGSFECVCPEGWFFSEAEGYEGTCDPGFIALSAGLRHTCGIKADDSLWCWGDNSQGALGLGHREPQGEPAQLLRCQSHRWKQVHASAHFTCALDSEGQAWCWGAHHKESVEAENNPLKPTPLNTEVRFSVLAGNGSPLYGIGLDGILYDLVPLGGIDPGPIYNSGQSVPQTIGPPAAAMGIDDPHVIRFSELEGWIDLIATVTGDAVCALRQIQEDEDWPEDAGKIELWCWGDNSNHQWGDSWTDEPELVDIGPFDAPPEIVVNQRRLCISSPELGEGLHCRGEDLPSGTFTTIIDSGHWRELRATPFYGSFCAINELDEVWCWGENHFGILGSGQDWQELNWRQMPEPVQLDTFIESAQLALGRNHACLATRAEGRLYCWGDNYFGQLAFPSWPQHRKPERIGTESDWKDLSLGINASCGLRQDGSLWCWGENHTALLAHDTLLSLLPVPRKVDSAQLWEKLSLGEEGACAIDSEKKMWCWGHERTFLQEYSLGNTFPTPTEVQVESSNTWLDLAVSHEFACGIRQGSIEHSGNLWCGGIAPQDLWLRPEPPPASGVSKLSGHSESSGVLRSSTSSRSSGSPETLRSSRINGPFGASGTSGPSDFSSSSALPPQASPLSQILITLGKDWRELSANHQWIQVSAGNSHLCLINSEDELFCLGNNGLGQLGVGESNYANDPVQVRGEEDNELKWSQVSAGDFHTCAITPDSRLFCWGDNYDAQLGIDSNGSPDPVYFPQQVEGTDWVQVSAGTSHTCATKSDGSAWCWGANFGGALGSGEESDDPDQVLLEQSFKQVEAGINFPEYRNGPLLSHSCGLGSDGSLWCWGASRAGATGNGAAGSLQPRASELGTPRRVSP